MAINLGEALRTLGHDVTVWSPHPQPANTKWWMGMFRMRSKLDEFIKANGHFHVIDSSAMFVTKRAHRSSLILVRSVQPELWYLLHDFLRGGSGFGGLVHYSMKLLVALICVLLVLRGYKKASLIFCLGVLELQWMGKHFPWWKRKLRHYVNALSPGDQKALAEIRARRAHESGHNGIRFLWIGRWAPHKRSRELLNLVKDWSGSHPQDSFTIAGCGSAVEKDWPAELLRSGALKIVPSFTREELYRIASNHDVGLFSSRVEGWGLSLNEMRESGMPVYATAAGGVPDLAAFFKGYLKEFPPPKGHAIDVRAAADMSFDEYYRVFSWSSIARKYVDAVWHCGRLMCRCASAPEVRSQRVPKVAGEAILYMAS